MNEADLAAIEARANAATPGPWKRDRNWHIVGPVHDWTADPAKNYCPDFVCDQRVAQVQGPKGSSSFNNPDADFAFIVAARVDIPTLAAEVRRLRAALADACDALEGYADTVDGDPPGPNRAMRAMTSIDIALGEA